MTFIIKPIVTEKMTKVTEKSQVQQMLLKQKMMIEIQP